MAITIYPENYYDDYNTPDGNGLTPEDKNYLRILFKPGQSVQARELNQAQSILQSQVDKLGQGLFQSNSPIVGGAASFDDTLRYVDTIIPSDFVSTFESWITNLPDVELKQTETTLTASISSVVTINENENSEDVSKTYRLFIHYTGDNVDDNDTNLGIFNDTDITIENNVTTGSFIGGIIKQGLAVGASIANGVFFIKGNCVPIKSQFKAIALDDDELVYTGKVVLSVTEDTVNYNDDGTLLDNSNGFPNYAAPGADRYQISLLLDLVKDETLELSNIVILEIQDSNIILETKVENNESPLNDIFATRTSEESGDYVLDPFSLEIRDIWGGDGEDGNPVGEFNGLYKSVQDLIEAGYESVTDSNDDYAVTIQPSTAYVKGYRVDLPEQISLFASRARESYADKNSGELLKTAITADLGTYVEGYIESANNEFGLPALDYSNVQTYTMWKTDDVDDFAERTYDSNSGEVLIEGSNVGTCRISTVEVLGENSDGKVRARLYLTDIARSYDNTRPYKDVKRIAVAGNVEITDIGTMDFIVEPKNGKRIHDTNISSSFLNLPYQTVKTVRSLKGTEKRILNGTAQLDPTDNKVKVTFTAEDNGFIDKSKSNMVVMVDNGDNPATYDHVPNDSFEIIGLGTSSADIITIDLTNFDSGSANEKEVRLLASVETNISERLGKKVKTSVTNLDVTDKIPNTDPVREPLEFKVGDKITLSNVYHLISVDTTEWELVNDGQRKNRYQEARVRCLKDGATTISYTHWDFVGSGNFYTVNSYKYADDSQVPLEEIPIFQQTSLHDVIDLRHVETANGRFSLDPYSTVEMELDFYLARKDLITVSSKGIFSILKGEADLKPKFPSVPDDSMILFNLTLFPYTFTLGGIIKDRVNNRRYTMRDIGQLDSRISNVEYYTALSLLEKSAKDKGVYGTDGEERFKNGFIVDGFRGHTVGNISEKYYKCSVKRGQGKLYPYHFGSNLPFDIVDESEIGTDAEFNKTCSTSRVIGFPYKETNYVNQQRGTQFISVQPYETINSSGIMELNPEVDTWVDTKTDPAIETDLFNELNTTISNLAREAGVLGTEWNSWQTNRNTLLSTQSQTNVLSESSLLLGDERTQVTTTDFQRIGFRRGIGITDITTQRTDVFDTSLTTTLSETIESETRRLDQTRTGTFTRLTEDSINKSLGTFLTSVSYKPFMRSRQVWVRVEDLKPNTRYYAFFDNVDVTKYVTRYTGSSDVLDFNANAGINRGFRFYNRRYLRASNGRTWGGQSPRTLVSDSDGVLQAAFIVPNTPSLKFASGEKTLKFTDSPRNLESEETSSAIARYISNGLGAVQQESIVSTSVPRLVVRPLQANRSVVRTAITDVSQSVDSSFEEVLVSSSTSTRVRRWDPVAQTFFVRDTTGIYATSVDVYFQKRGRKNVRAYLVTVENGYPTNKILPGSERVLRPSQVKTSNNSSIATKFEFKKPVYLNGKTEYAVVVFSVDPSYTVYIAEMGGEKVDLITNQIISKQPAIGSFFTSSNKRTWTAEQNRDLKFKLRRATFKTGRATIKAQARVGGYLDSVEITNGGSGYTTSTTVSMSVPQELNTSGVLVDVPDSTAAEGVAVIDANTGAIADIVITNEGEGYTSPPTITIEDIGGGEGATAVGYLPTIKFAAANLNQSAMSISGKTSIVNKLTLNNKRYNIQSNTPIELRDVNHSVNAGNAEDTTLDIIIGTSDNRVTPMLEKNGIALEVRSYFIEEKGGYEDEKNTSQYYTKKITLETPSDQVDVYAAINRPSATSEIQFFIKMFDDEDGVRLNPDVTPSDDNDQNEWWEITPTEPKVVPINSDGKTYSDVLFRKNLEEDTSDIDFTSFIIKAVMWGKNNTDIVTVKDLRIIATA